MTLATDLAAAGDPTGDDDWEDLTVPIAARVRPARRRALAVGTEPPAAEQEPASPEQLHRLGNAILDTSCTALEAVMRVVRWEVDELEVFSRETGVSPGDLFQPGLVRGLLHLRDSLAGAAIDAVGAAASERLIAAGARTIRRMSRAFGGSERVIDEQLAELAAAARRAQEGMSRREAGSLMRWAVSERRQAEAIAPRAGALANALLTLWLVKSAAGPFQPRDGIDEQTWRLGCRKVFGVEHVPPAMMARLQLELIWISMGLAVNGSVGWPPGGIGRGTAVFSYAANPRALAAAVEGHSRDGARYRHLAAGGSFRLVFRFTVRAHQGPDGAGGLAGLEYDLDLDGPITR